MIGWMSNWQDAMLVPASIRRGMFSPPHKLSLKRTEHGDRLVQQPIHELQNLRAEHDHWRVEIIQPESNLLKDNQGLEIVTEFQIAKDVKFFDFRVRVGVNEYRIISYSVEDEALILDRAHSGEAIFHGAFAAIHSAKLTPINNVIHLHIFIDTLSVEAFVYDGLVVLMNCIFPSPQSYGLEFFTEGGQVVVILPDVYQLNPAKFQVAN
jgi:fructan beta-fructosidase